MQKKLKHITLDQQEMVKKLQDNIMFKSKYRFDISDIYLFTRLTLRKVNALFFLRSNEVILLESNYGKPHSIE